MQIESYEMSLSLEGERAITARPSALRLRHNEAPARARSLTYVTGNLGFMYDGEVLYIRLLDRPVLGRPRVGMTRWKKAPAA